MSTLTTTAHHIRRRRPGRAGRGRSLPIAILTLLLAGAALTGALLLPTLKAAPVAHAQGTTVTPTATPSADSTLMSLTVEPGALIETFASGTTSYTAVVPEPATMAEITAMRTHAMATVAITDSGGTSVSTGDAHGEDVRVNLDVGANEFTITVTAENTTTTDYTFTIHRARTTVEPGGVRGRFRASPYNGASGNNNLRFNGTYLDGNTVHTTAGQTLNFTQDSTNNDWTNLSLFVCKKDFARNIDPSDNSYSFHITDASADSDCTASGTVTGTAGAGTGAVTMSAEDIAHGGAVLQVQHTTTNVVYFAQWLPVRFHQDAHLYGLTIDPATLRGGFSPGTRTYSGVVPVGGPYVTIAYELADTDATVTIADPSPGSTTPTDASPEPGLQLPVAGTGGLTTGSSRYNITVTAADGTTPLTYSITLHRARQPASTVNQLARSEDYNATGSGDNHDLVLTTLVLDGHAVGEQTLNFTQASSPSPTWTDLDLFLCPQNNAFTTPTMPSIANLAVADASASGSGCIASGTLAGTAGSVNGTGTVSLLAGNAANANAVIQIQDGAMVHFSQLVNIRFNDDAALTTLSLTQPTFTNFLEGEFLPTSGYVITADVTVDFNGPVGAQRRTVTYRSTAGLTRVVAAGIEQITVTPTLSNPGATWEIVGANDAVIPDLDNDASNGRQVPLAVGLNTVKVRVTAPDGVTQTSYVLSLWRTRPAVRPTPSLHRTTAFGSSGTDLNTTDSYLPADTMGNVLSLSQPSGTPVWTGLSAYICRLDTVGGATDRADTDDACRVTDSTLGTTGASGSAAFTLAVSEIAEGSLVIKIQNTTSNEVVFSRWLPFRFNHDATLRALEVTNGELLSNLSANPLRRGFDLAPDGANPVTITPVTVNSTATVGTYSEADADGALDGHQVAVTSLPVNLTFVVTPASGNPETYTINIANVTDYDADDDNLIDLNLASESGAAANTNGVARLKVIRHDLDGDGAADDSSDDAAYNAAFANRPTYGMGCPEGCRGYELINSLDLTGEANWDPIGDWAAIGGAVGSSVAGSVITPYDADFAGNGFTIDNLTINRGNQTGVGLFRALAKDRRIRGVGLTDADVTGHAYVGALVGINYGTVAATYSTGAVNGAVAVGALVGLNGRSSVTVVLPNGQKRVVGKDATVLASWSDADATATVSPENNRLPPDCEEDPDRPGKSRCDPGPQVATAPPAGSLVGFNEGVIKASYAIGRADKGMGLAGSNAGTIEDSYWDRQVSGASGGNVLAGLDAQIAALEADPTAVDPDTNVNPQGQTNAVRAAALRNFRNALLLGFGAGHKTTSELFTPTAAAGIYADWDDLDIDGDGAADDDPWVFGTAHHYPRLDWMNFDPNAQRKSYDSDGDNLIEITTLAQLNAIRLDLNGDGSSPTDVALYAAAYPDHTDGMGCAATCTGYELLNDLDFDTDGDDNVADAPYAAWTPIGASSSAAYAGSFHGNGHTISNLRINASGTGNTGGGISGVQSVGLFGHTSGTLEGVGLLNVDIDGTYAANQNRRWSVGGLVGETVGLIRSSFVTGEIDITASGGGTNGASIKAGGLAGRVSQHMDTPSRGVIASWADVAVTVASTAPTNNGAVWKDHVGGLVGQVVSANARQVHIIASYATGTVTDNRSAGAAVGGLLGGTNNSTASVVASYATGAPTATGTAGANVVAGGLVGELGSATTITASYWDTGASGVADSDQANSPGEGKTTSELQTPTGYTGIYMDWNRNVDNDAATGDGSGNDDPWDFGGASVGDTGQYPILTFGYSEESIALQRAAATTTDYDTDDNGLIEIKTLVQLNAIRFDLNGDGAVAAGDADGYALAYPKPIGGMGCPAPACTGYELEADLDFDTAGDDDVADAPYAEWTPLPEYTATFDGKGHIIANLNIDSTSNLVGLFARLNGASGVIRSLGLINPTIMARGTGDPNYVGALVGENNGGAQIYAVYVSGGSVTSSAPGAAVGGLAGRNNSGSSIIASYAIDTPVVVSGSGSFFRAGGLVGGNYGATSTIRASWAASMVTNTGSSSATSSGGLLGYNSGAIDYSYHDGGVESDNTGGTSQTNSLLVGTDEYTGIYQDWNLNLDGEAGDDDPWDFGGAVQYPLLTYGFGEAGIARQRANLTFTDYDTDGNNLIEVTTLAQLNAIRHDLDGNGATHADYTAVYPRPLAGMGCPATCTGYELANDLDFDTGTVGDRTDDEYYNGGAGWTPIGVDSAGAAMPFTGTFDGSGHTIANLHINLTTSTATGGGFVGLFGDSTGTIRNVGLLNPDVTSARTGLSFGRTAALVGRNDTSSGTVSNSYVSGGTVTHSQSTASSSIGFIGCLAGYSSGTVSDSWASCAVSAAGTNTDRANSAVNAGGLTGSSDLLISDSYATGTVTVSGSVLINAGGLTGAALGNITGSSASGAVTSTASADDSLGGLVGNGSGASCFSIRASYATGDVTSAAPDSELGGLAGILKTCASDVVQASYATGSVSASGDTTHAGGLIGSIDPSADGTVQVSYAVGAVASTGTGGSVGGLVGDNESSTVTMPVAATAYWDTGTTGQAASVGGGQGQSARALKGPTGYTAIYANWDVDVDNADTDNDPATGEDDPWDFGADRHYPALKYGDHDLDRQRPVDANAGVDRRVFIGDTVTLDGSGSRATGLGAVTYQWRQIREANELAVSLSGATSAQATFTAPEVEADVTLEFELTVTAGGRSSTDLVEVEVSFLPPTRNGLSALSVTADGTARPLTPAFANDITAYRAAVGAHTTSATIAFDPADPGAYLYFDGRELDATTLSVTVGLAEGSNRFTILVAPPDPVAGEEVATEGPDAPRSVTYYVTISRQPVPRLALTPSRLTVNEGDSADYTVGLDTRWLGAEVTVAITSSNPAVTVSPSSVSFRPTDWDARTVRVTAAADDDTEDASAVLSHAASGGHFDNVFGSVRVTVNDTTGVSTPEPTPTPSPTPTPGPGETPTPTPTPEPTPSPTPTPMPTPEPTPGLSTTPVTFTTELILNGHTVTITREAGSLAGVTVALPSGLDRNPHITISPAPGPHPQMRPPLRLGQEMNAIAGVRVVDEPSGGLEICLPVPEELSAEAGANPLTLARYDGAGGGGWRVVPESRRPGSGTGSGAGAGTGGGAAGGDDAVCAAGIRGLAGGSTFAVAYTIMPVGVPADLTVAPGDAAGTLTLRWTAGAGATRHWVAGIKQSDWNAGDFSNLIWTAADSNTMHALSGLDSGAEYVFTVAAGRGAGVNTEWSAWARLIRGTPD